MSNSNRAKGEPCYSRTPFLYLISSHCTVWFVLLQRMNFTFFSICMDHHCSTSMQLWLKRLPVKYVCSGYPWNWAVSCAVSRKYIHKHATFLRYRTIPCENNNKLVHTKVVNKLETIFFKSGYLFTFLFIKKNKTEHAVQPPRRRKGW